MNEPNSSLGQKIVTSGDSSIRVILDKPASQKVFSGVWTVVKILFVLGLFSSLFVGAEYETAGKNIQKQYFNEYFGDEVKDPSARELVVVNLSGEMVNSPSESFSPTTQIAADDVIYLLQSASEDPDIAAILLRLNTPGGSVLAADRITQMIQKVQEKKPVFTLMEEVAASAGYYISSGTKKIYAYPSTLTGNIGVLIQLPQIKDLLEKIGFDMRLITSGKFKDMGSPFREVTPEEEQLFHELIQESYDVFTNVVAKGRNMPLEKVRSLADGRIYSGLQAKENGLIDDTVDSFATALEKIKQEMNITALQPVFYEIPLSPWEEIFASAESFFSPIQGVSSELQERLLHEGPRLVY